MITINKHSSIKIAGEKILYFDPFEVEKAPHDADIIFITHKHFDHFEPDSIRALAKPSTIIVAPKSIKEDVLSAGFDEDWCEFLAPYEEAEIDGIKVETVPSYNTNKPNHLKEFGWLGYIVTMKGGDEIGLASEIRYYVAGDTDDNEDIRKVQCDVALVPAGGTYTMNADEAAAFVCAIKPAVAIPTHYGSIVGDISCGEDFKAALKKLDPEIEVKLLIN